MSQRPPSTTDVLIVGGGPAGLTLSITLTQLGVDHVIIDAKDAVTPGGRAASVQPRTLEYLDRLGVADRLIDDGLQGLGFAAEDGDRSLINISYADVASPYQFLLLIQQDQTEIRLEERLNELGKYVVRGARLLDMVDEYPGSAATLVLSDGATHVINARYVVGADGLHSTVRRFHGIDFLGDAPPQVFALADVVLEGYDADAAETTFSLSRNGMLTTSALSGGLFRMVALVPDDSAPPTLDDVEKFLRERAGSWADNAVVTSIKTSSIYHVQERVVATMRSANAFLLGDAAHTHSPAGGQGMNTGIQDAANLGWKLHHVLTGRMGPTLLDSFDVERRPVAKGLVGFTSQLMSLATIKDAATATMRNDILAAAANVPGVIEYLSNRLAQLDVGYPSKDPDDMISGRRVDPRIVKPNGVSWTLVTPEGTSPHDVPDDVTITTSSEVKTAIAVRPDGIAADPQLAAEALGIDVHADNSSGVTV